MPELPANRKLRCSGRGVLGRREYEWCRSRGFFLHGSAMQHPALNFRVVVSCRAVVFLPAVSRPRGPVFRRAWDYPSTVCLLKIRLFRCSRKLAKSLRSQKLAERAATNEQLLRRIGAACSKPASLPAASFRARSAEHRASHSVHARCHPTDLSSTSFPAGAPGSASNRPS